jgi:hypothetical protein
MTTATALAPTDAPLLTRRDKAIATAEARSATLFQDGYKCDPDADMPGRYHVSKTPELLTRRPLRPGESASYEVDVTTGECSCPAYAWLGTCKHRVAVLRAVAEAVRLLGPMLPRG